MLTGVVVNATWHPASQNCPMERSGLLERAGKM